MNEPELKRIIEAVIFAAEEPLNLNQLMSLFAEDAHPGREAILQALDSLQQDYAEHSLELREVGSGYRFQVRQDFAQWVARLWEEKPARYTRATLETLALIAYRQPLTRAEIEEIRGVSVSSQIMKSLQERDWIKVVGHRDVPGKPALYATTREFLDYFNLKSLEDLPSLAELSDIDSLNAELSLELVDEHQAESGKSENMNPDELAEQLQPQSPAGDDAVAAERNADEAANETQAEVLDDNEQNPVPPRQILSAES